MKKTIRYSNEEGEEEILLIDKIIKFTHCDFNNNWTSIHLDTGEIIHTIETFEQLEKKLNEEE